MAETKIEIKTAPHSKESEMMVLGCMLSSHAGLTSAAEGLEGSDFYFAEHKILFDLLKGFYYKDKPADIHLVSEELKRTNLLDEIGGVSYLTSLVQYAGTSAFIEEYVNLIKDKSILRKMISASQLVEKEAMNVPDDVSEVLDKAQSLFFKISQARSQNEGVTIQQLLSGEKAETKIPYLTELQNRQENYQNLGEDGAKFTGIPTHFVDLDRMLDGFNPSNLMILAARPAMGKTALAINIAENICFKNDLPVLIFSLEMSAEQLLHRVICSQSEIESEKIKTGSIEGIEYQKIVSVVSKMQKHTMIIDDQPGLKVTDLSARARRLKEIYNISFIVIDYLQLLSGGSGSRGSENRQSEISEISRTLKNLARELNVPILCLSQLSRKVEERPGHRPMMSDLRESGSIEQDSDIVMFLLRREYYDPYDKPGMAELIVAKNRHGGVGSVQMSFRKEVVQFANYTEIKEEGNDEAFSAFTP